LVRATLENRGEGNFIDGIVTFLYEAYHEEWERVNPSMSSEDVSFLFRYVTSGLIGVLRYWIISCPEMDVDEIISKAEYLMRLSSPGVIGHIDNG
jgi:hypothetical protein